MTYFYISEECIECGSCAPFCKNGAIEWVEIRYVIDSTKCDACGTCREYCPMDAAILEFQESGLSPAQPNSSI